MIIMGAGICQWFHGDATYRAILSLLILTGCDGPQRRRLGALRRPGEVPPDHRLDLAGQRAGLVPPAADDDRHVVLVHAHRPVAHRRLLRRRARLAAGQGPPRAACTPPTRSRSRPRLGWMPFYPQFDREPAGPGRRGDGGGRGRRGRRPGGVRRRRAGPRRPQAGDRGRRRPGELAAHAGAVALQPVRLARPRATSTS